MPHRHGTHRHGHSWHLRWNCSHRHWIARHHDGRLEWKGCHGRGKLWLRRLLLLKRSSIKHVIGLILLTEENLYIFFLELALASGLENIYGVNLDLRSMRYSMTASGTPYIPQTCTSIASRPRLALGTLQVRGITWLEFPYGLVGDGQPLRWRWKKYAYSWCSRNDGSSSAGEEQPRHHTPSHNSNKRVSGRALSFLFFPYYFKLSIFTSQTPLHAMFSRCPPKRNEAQRVPQKRQELNHNEHNHQNWLLDHQSRHKGHRHRYEENHSREPSGLIKHGLNLLTEANQESRSILEQTYPMIAIILPRVQAIANRSGCPLRIEKSAPNEQISMISPTE